MIRLAITSRMLQQPSLIRAIKQSTKRFNETATQPQPTFVAPVVVKPPPPRRGGYFSGSLTGFLVGTSLTGLACYVFLLDEYQQSSNSLLSTVEDVATSVAKVKDYTKKIVSVEKDLKTHKSVAATKDDIETLRNELLKAIDDLRVEHLESKTQLWELTQSVVSLQEKSKSSSS
ncbi:hypothetical protein SmJEL517_g01777 [Synchytrium microbalum]|uniref:Uncharacterized protein n=1 Tax=Synchytrium microbalum TaxID=1806994 RepID=A0A507CDN3_9FUNG|nr:uncharacterized protein SmJEL517_g01777 [Synchytrium microbalum]TPX36024.1 hypothetical protein SmJEL517_g01777 [Synchytrium microbalum]